MSTSSSSSYSTGYYSANPYSSISDVASSAASTSDAVQSTEITATLASRTEDYLSDYLAALEEAAEKAAAAITEQYELAASQAYEDKNNMISLAQQEYLKSINPYGTTSESLAAYGFDQTGGYSVSNAQSNYANYVSTQNSANTAYQDAITDLKLAAIDSQLDSNYFYTDISADLVSGLESIYSQIAADTSEANSDYQEDLLSALEFVETLYNISPTKVSSDNSDLQEYIERVYGVTGDDYDFIVNSVLNLLGQYSFAENDFWNQFD